MPGSPTDRGDIGDTGSAQVGVTTDVYLWFVDRALGQMVAIVEGLGDDVANRRPPFRDANSAYAILTHCLGVMEYWGGATVAQRPVQRDRAAEFTATGDVAGLLRRTEHARRRLREDVVGLNAQEEPVNVRRDPDKRVPYTETKGAVLLHLLQELSQHLGQMELTRDSLESTRRR